MARSSLLHWFPRIKDLGIPVPKTGIVPVDHRAMCKDHDRSYPAALAREVEAVVADLDLSYPIFIKGDEAAGKHRYRDTCYVESPEVLAAHIYEVAGENVLNDLTLEAIVVREYIPLAARFEAFNGLPIAPERRYFVEDGAAICSHPYWPRDAIEFWNEPEPDGWREALAAMNTESTNEVALLSGYAARVSAVLDGAWSVDFALGRNGTWYLIDMAEACVSWHPGDCPAYEGHGMDPTLHRQAPPDIDAMLVPIIKHPTNGDD